MHLHAQRASAQGPPGGAVCMPPTEFIAWDPRVPLNPGTLVRCPKPVTGARTDEFLQRLVDAGMGQRIMFGSDQMVWPEAIEATIEAIETATFLTPQGKR